MYIFHAYNTDQYSPDMYIYLKVNIVKYNTLDRICLYLELFTYFNHSVMNAKKITVQLDSCCL